MPFFLKRAALLLAVPILAGCAPSPPLPDLPKPAHEVRAPGVTLNGAGGDTRGTVLYQPSQPPKTLPNPYALVSDKFVLARRQQMAWALAEIDGHAHLQALHAYPVPDPSWKGYSKVNASLQAQRQARFNAYLLEKYHARFCNQFHVTYDQLILLIKEGREKGWPMPPVPTE